MGIRSSAFCCLGIGILSLSGANAAETVTQRLDRLEATVRAQAQQLELQQNKLAEQSKLLDRQNLPPQQVSAPQKDPAPPARTAASIPAADMEQQRGAGLPNDRIAQAEPAVRPVGEAPPTESKVQIQSLPEDISVLTPPGKFVFEPEFDYTNTSSNRLVFRGIEIVTGIQLGVIDASSTSDNTFVGTMDLRYGVTSRLEIEARLPYVYRSDRVTTLSQRGESVTQTFNLTGHGIGDGEIGARYQLNNVEPDEPVFVGSLRLKSDLGSSPYGIPFDEFGVAESLPTGSGFWAVEPGVSMLLPSDPAVIFASLNYIYSVPKNIDRQIGNVFVGRISPGSTVETSVGFGLAINPRFSFSLGFRNDYVLPTLTTLGGTHQSSEALEVGMLTFGWSYALTHSLTLNSGIEVGLTADAPDMHVFVRLPYRF